MRLLRDFLNNSKTKFSPESYSVVKEALRVAIKLLKGRTRYNGEPFINHSIGVAAIVLHDMKLDETTVVSAILHDVARFNLMPKEQIRDMFGESVAEVLFGMNNISDVNMKMSGTQAEHFKDMIISYSTNPRIILLKVADRTEVMRALDAFPPEKRAKKSWESLYIYSQIAHKLGYYALKSEMEDLALKYLEPEDYTMIKESLETSEAERELFIKQFVSPVQEQLDKKGLTFKIKGRTKSIYSIWRKMTTQKVAFSEVYDVFAIRIVIDCPREDEKSLCWYAFSVVTDFYKPNPKRMRDWISIPKSNGYESLHTTVVTDKGRWVEVQIRTQRMDDVAENGLAAHWRYKGVKSGEESAQEWLDRLRGAIDNMDMSSSTMSLDKDLSLDSKEVFVFTPTGDLRKLREGATILDFAYDIHSDVGNHCIAGKINHRTATIRDTLSSGDLVEIVTSKNQTPRADWLNIVVTSKAKSRIKAYLRDAQQKEFINGKEELDRKLKNWKMGLDLDTAVVTLCKHFKFKTGLELYRKISLDELSMSEIKSLLTRHLAGELLTRGEERLPKVKAEKDNKPNKDLLVVGNNLEGMQYKFAQCCTPLYGDEIFGFVTILNGITIHRRDCVNSKQMQERYPYRIIDAEWQGSEKVGKQEVTIELQGDDTISSEALRSITKSIGVELRSINSEYNGEKMRTTVKINVTDRGVVESILYLFKQLDGVEKGKSI